MDEDWIARARAHMRAHGISHRDLAGRLGCTRGAVGHYLSGRRAPSLKQLSRIARALRVGAAWLLHGDRADAVREAAAEYAVPAQRVPLLSGRPGRARRAGHLPVWAPGRKCYALCIADDRHAPRIYAGESVLVDPDIKPSEGDEVLAQLRTGPPAVYTLIGSGRGRVTLETVSGRRHRLQVPGSEVESLHTVIAVFRAGGRGR